MLRFSAFLLSLSVLLTACGNGLEVKDETDALGFRKEYEVDPETGLKEGFLREYYPTGELSVEEAYTNDQLNGTRKVFSENGQVLVLENIVMDEYDGEHITYDEDGNLVMKGSYIDGAMNKAWFTYYPDGGVKAAMTFVDNEENGPVRMWYENGQPMLSGEFEGGDEFSGVLHRYTEDGELERILNCAPGAGCRTFWTVDSMAAPVGGVDMTRPVL